MSRPRHFHLKDAKMKIGNAKIRVPSVNLDKISQGTTNPLNPINVFNQTRKGEFYLLSTSQLIPYKNQARVHFDEEKIEELARTIETHGIRQPLTIIKSEEFPEKYEVVSGERRFRAARLAKVEKIPCILLEDRAAAEEISIIENIQRQDLHPLELARAYSQLYNTKKYKNQNDMAEKLGVTRTHVSEYLKFNDFSTQERELIIGNKISDRDTLRKLISINDKHKRKEFLDRLIQSQTSQNYESISTKSLTRKSKVVTIFFEKGELKYTSNFMNKLNEDERLKLKSLLQNMLKMM